MPLTNLGLRHLRCFVVLAEELHFARAAARLHLSQPALSQTLKQLELATGLQLPARTTRRVELTPDGAALREDALQVLASFDELVERAHARAAGRLGTLRVGFSIGAAVDLVPRILRAYAEHGTWRDYWLGREYRDGVPPNVVAEVATFESELQTVASGRGISITAEAASRFYARPGLRFPRIADMPPCEVAVAIPAGATPAARAFARIAVRSKAKRSPPPTGSGHKASYRNV